MRIVFILILVINYIHTTAQDLTIPDKNYAGKLNFDTAPERGNDLFPLSDQNNEGNWVLFPDYSDEFDAEKLNTEKWYGSNPKWEGREPTFFHASNVSLSDGELIFKINQHGEEDLPKGFTHTSGFIKSKKRILYGYFEAELKLMNAPWVSCFWLTNVGDNWWTEIDICENCPGVATNRHDLNSNVHVFRAPKNKGDVKKHFDISKKYYIPFELQADYHVWGLYWTEEYIRFYIDGVLFREAENTHWHQELEININNESNKWFGALPDDSRLEEEYRVKYLRVWKRQ